MTTPIENPTRTLPHAPGLEKSLLSSILQEPAEFIPRARGLGLTTAHFYQPSHSLLYGFLLDLADHGQEIELISLVQRLLDKGLLDRVGGPSTIQEIYTYAPSPAMFENHFALVHGKFLERKLIELSGDTIGSIYDSPGEVSAVLEETSRKLDAIHKLATGGRESVEDTRAVLDRCVDRYRDLVEEKASPMGMATSIPLFNQLFRGLHPGYNIIISAYPGGGKTTLATQLALDCAEQGHNTLIISLEMTAEEIMNRAWAYIARVPGKAIADPLGHARQHGHTGPTREELKKLRLAGQKLAAMPFSVVPLAGPHVHEIISRIRLAHRRRPLELVVVDFVQRIRAAPEMRKETREQQLAQSSNFLADLAKELRFCLLLPSQLSKDGATKHAETINEDGHLHFQILQNRSGPGADHSHCGIAVFKDRHHGQDGKVLPVKLNGGMLRFEGAGG